ncbi:hypothetical protein [Ruminococcus gauvreauii]|uniref:Uncharacterized protein n=1 Tax=Ruminococcus gauvreauii TaxID=438033 RepID=A0ABY5VM03_9FIRM|nr:hypothetical protein [Ruminococcus gauvreauii]UWP61028.1 hypothetical protein NQ502_08365 [Ruminococcus gauvreauii]
MNENKKGGSIRLFESWGFFFLVSGDFKYIKTGNDIPLLRNI